MTFENNKKYGYATRKVQKIQNFKAVALGLNIIFLIGFLARIVFLMFEIQYVKADQNEKY